MESWSHWSHCVTESRDLAERVENFFAVEKARQRAGIDEVKLGIHYLRRLLRPIASRNEAGLAAATGLDLRHPMNSAARSPNEACSNSRANRSRTTSDSDLRSRFAVSRNVARCS
jgi:hypothetical protein